MLLMMSLFDVFTSFCLQKCFLVVSIKGDISSQQKLFKEVLASKIKIEN